MAKSGFFNIDPDRMKDLAANAENVNKGGGGSDVVWLKFNAGKHVLRILPPWSSDGIVVRTFQRHKGPFGSPYSTVDGYNVQPMCLKWIQEAKNATFRQILLDTEKLTEADLAQARKYGCPLCWLPLSIMKQDIDKKLKKEQASPFWATTRHLFNFAYVEGPGPIAPGTVAVGDQSNKFYKAIMANAEMIPDLFDIKTGRNFKLEATGEKQSRRYEPPVIHPSGSAISVKPEDLYNLDELAAKSTRGFEELVSIAERNHTNYSEAWRVGPYLQSQGASVQQQPQDDPFAGITDDDIPF